MKQPDLFNDLPDISSQKIPYSSHKVQSELHRLMGFIRFNPGPNGIWLARCAPDYALLPALEDYFIARFGEDSWAIIDEKRNTALLCLKGRKALYGDLSLFPVLFEDKPETDNWEELWKLYHRSVTIENRKNLKLQKQFIPSRYREYLPELKC